MYILLFPLFASACAVAQFVFEGFMAHNVLTIGRSKESNIFFSDNTVSRRHAELVVSENGTYFLTDCASRHGTFLMKNGQWLAIRQSDVGADDRVRIAERELNVSQLIAMSNTHVSSAHGSSASKSNNPAAGGKPPAHASHGNSSRGQGGQGSHKEMLEGEIMRNPGTGEVEQRD